MFLLWNLKAASGFRYGLRAMARQTTTMRLTSRSKLQGDCMRIHYFYREPSGQQMIDEDTKRFGFQPSELLALVDRFAPPSSGLES